MIEYKTSNGKIMRFDDNPLNQGGEGAIYKQYDELGHGDIGDLAKIFHDGKSEGKEEKIRAMISIQSPVPSDSFTWPKEILYDVNTGKFCGYVMYMKYNKKELGEISAYDCQYRKEKGWKFYLNIAKSLAQTVAGLHDINQVVGDLNDKNVLIDVETARVTLIDNDSFHITTDSATHRCCVGMGEYIAPEIQGINFRESALPTFTEHTDNFSLAILIFKLLMNGLHPFNSATIDDSSIEVNIKNGKSPFFMSENKGKSSVIPPYAPPIELIPVKLYKMFKLAFNDSLSNPSKRPTAQQFYDVLNEISDESSIVKCELQNHMYPKGMSSCPWCYVEDRMYLLRNGELKDDFNYSSYSKKYKDAINKQKKEKKKSVSQSGPVQENSDYIEHVSKNAFSSGITNASVSNTMSMSRSQIPAVAVQVSGNNLPFPVSSSTVVNTTIVPPAEISAGRKTFCVLGSVGLLLVALATSFIAFKFANPLIVIMSSVILVMLSIIALPRFDKYPDYKSIVEFPDYITVKCKEKKDQWYVVVPKVRIRIFTFLILSLIITLSAATILALDMKITWIFVIFTFLTIVNTYYVTDKRTLWTKTPIGIIVGVISILMIVLAFILFAGMLLKVL